MNQEICQCQNCKNEFTIEPDDFAFYEKMKVPPPTWCPECRFRRLSLFRNETTLYSRQCDLCKKSIISSYSPDSPYTIYCQSCWYSDKWDARSYAMDYNSERDFVSQLKELTQKVPKFATYTSSFGKNVNSEYVNFAGGKEGMKNCFMCFNSGEGEDSMYCRGVRFVRNVGDAYYGLDLERCYEVVNAEKSTGVSFSQNIEGCLDSSFLYGCTNCTNCFGCVNVRHGNHKFLNEQLSKEEYLSRINKIRGSYKETEEFKKQFDEFALNFPRRATVNLRTLESTGDFLFETKNVKDSFETAESENSRFLYFAKAVKDSYNIVGFGYESQLLLETAAVGYTSRAIGCAMCDNSQDIEYCFAMKQSRDCLGCDGLKNGEFCILNKTYSEEEYKKLREEIISELKEEGLYGGALSAVAPYAYNETVAQDNMPLSKEEALAMGFRWQENVQITKGKETIELSDIPDNIKDTSPDVCHETFACISCGRNYKIIPQEFQLYQQLVVPLPRKCFFCRHIERIHRRGPFKLSSRICAKCGKEIKTTYAPDRPEIVYCEQCYQQEVI